MYRQAQNHSFEIKAKAGKKLKIGKNKIGDMKDEYN